MKRGRIKHIQAQSSQPGWLTLLGQRADFGLVTKTGFVPKASFSGGVKTAAVTFTEPFESTAYSVQLTPLVTNAASSYAPVYLSPTTTGFTISLATGGTANLTGIAWIAVENGEST